MTRPFSISGLRMRVIELIGTAKLIPADWPTWLMIAVFMPITWPREFRSGPPELPGLIAASVWMIPLIIRPFLARSERSRLLTIPDGQRPLQAERVAQRQDLLPDQHARRIAERHRDELVRRDLDLEHGHIVGGVGADDLGRVGRAVEERRPGPRRPPG